MRAIGRIALACCMLNFLPAQETLPKQPTETAPAAVPPPDFIKPVRKGVYQRREIGSWKPEQIQTLRKGVAAMMARPASDPTSWHYQANLYATSDAPLQPGWQSGQQGNYFFLAWNRMHLYWFERILRASSGDPQFCLPYWNFSSSERLVVPSAYREPKDNPLHVEARAPGVNQGLPLPQALTTYASAFRFTNFEGPPGSPWSFGGQRAATPSGFAWPHGQLESRTADSVQILLGGEKGWLSRPELAARDPLFYLVRTNLDRLWKRWLDDGAGRRNPSLGETAWAKTSFLFFDENGKEVRMSGSEIIDSLVQLSYGYDDDSSFAAAPIAMSLASKEREEGVYEPLTTIISSLKDLNMGIETREWELPLDESSRILLNRQIGPVDQKGLLVLLFDEIEVTEPLGLVWELYLNLPKDQKPEGQTPFFLGGLAFYATPKGIALQQRLEITHQVRAQKKRRLWSETQMRLTLVPRAVDEKGLSKLKTKQLKVGKLHFQLEK